MSNPPSPANPSATPDPALSPTPVIAIKVAKPIATRSKMLYWSLFSLAMFLMLSCTLLSFGGDLLENGGLAIIGAIAALLPVPIYVGLFLWLDRFEPEPPHLLVAAFIWGAGIAGLFACVLNTVVGMIFAQVVSPGLADQLTASISAPLMEEGLKGIGVAILFFWLKDQFDGVIDGIIYAGMIALGFAMIENVAYYARGMNGGVVQFGLTFFVRGILSPYAHVLFTAMTGIGFGLARQAKSTPVRFAAPFFGWLAAMALHCTWNTLPFILDQIFPSGGPLLFFVLYGVFWIPVFFVFLALIAVSLRRESRLISKHLLEENADNPLISPEDATAAARLLPRLIGNVNVLITQGGSSWVTLRRYQHATTSLAFYRYRLDNKRVLANPELEALYVQQILDNRPSAKGGR